LASAGPGSRLDSTGICKSGSRKAKITHKKEKKVHSVKSWMFYLERWCCPYINLYIEKPLLFKYQPNVNGEF
jgi:hypothetical protein